MHAYARNICICIYYLLCNDLTIFCIITTVLWLFVILHSGHFERIFSACLRRSALQVYRARNVSPRLPLYSINPFGKDQHDVKFAVYRMWNYILGNTQYEYGRGLLNFQRRTVKCKLFVSVSKTFHWTKINLYSKKKKQDSFLAKVILVVTSHRHWPLKCFLLSHDDWISLPKAHDYDKATKKK